MTIKKSIFTAGDLIFIGFLITAFILSLFVFNFNKKADAVVIFQENKLIYRLPVQEDAIIEISGVFGLTEVTILNGKVSVTKASCPYKTCRQMGEIHQAGRIIVCLPNRILIQIEGRHENDVDGITM